MCVCALHPLDLSTTEKGRRGVLEVVEPDVWDNRSAHYVERPVPAPRPRDTPTPPGRTANKVGLASLHGLHCNVRFAAPRVNMVATCRICIQCPVLALSHSSCHCTIS